MSEIAVVVPSYRKDLYEETFLLKWKEQFEKYDVTLLTIWDEEDPAKTTLQINNQAELNIKEIMGRDMDLICNRYAGVRSLGLAYVGMYLPEIKYVVSLDDDVEPDGDTIGDHLRILQKRVPLSWIPIGDHYTRGFPYNARTEAEVVFSHGVWKGVPDFDAPTQLLAGAMQMTYFKMPIPKGVLAPLSYMNTAFKRKMLPYIFMCPQVPGQLERCDDIWCSIEAKRAMDTRDWGAVTGFSSVLHKRASNVFKSLAKEARFIELNEGYWKGEQDDPYFKMYHERRQRWQNLPWLR